MKQYIIPAVEMTVLKYEGVIATSFCVGGTTGEDNHEITVGGSTDDSNGVGQLTSGFGGGDDWTE